MIKTWKDQETPALAIVARGDQIRYINPNTFQVKSQSNPEASYIITKKGKKLVCTCDHYKKTKTCIHTLAIQFKEDLKQSAINIGKQKPICEQCNSKNVIRNGKRHNKSGTINRYQCKDCGFRFTDNNGFQKKRADPKKIALALDLYFRGLSVRKVSEHFSQVYNLSISHMTIYRWIRDYSKLASEWLNKQKISTGERWHVDETFVTVDGKRRFLWNVLDANSRYLLAIHVSKNRNMKNTRIPFKKAKKVTNNKPSEIFTDHMMGYPRAIRKEFVRRKIGYKNRGWFSPHVQVDSIRAKESNNLIERFHGTEKERIKVMRGFDRDYGCKSIMDGFRVHYNIIRDHQSIGMTPAESAGIQKIEGFRWYELLKKAIEYQKRRDSR